ncbi:GumC family protein [Microbulbifer elongatus]|uniref:GumC family protein n=1 Tax=Microbulbifer elongatus TaxID=86173 RepID=UPI001CFE0A1B|nr:polysaccharide biosynthesis tyrosine autokinase [Microbulbifer elongatus]
MNIPSSPQHARHDMLPQEEYLDLQKYLRLLWLHKATILVTTLVFALLGAAVMSIQPKRYTATATISFETGRANITEIREVVEDGPENRDYLQTQAEILKSRQLIARVIRRLDLSRESLNAPQNPLLGLFTGGEDVMPGEVIEAPLAAEATTPASEEDDNSVANSTEPSVEADSIPTNTALTDYMAHYLVVEQVRGTQLIKISYESYSATLSAEIANGLAQEYLLSQTETKKEVTSKAADWLDERLDTLRKNLETSERALHDFQRENNLVDLDGVRGLATQELNDVTTQLLEAKRELQLVTTNYQLVRRKNGDAEALLMLPQVQSHPTIQGIRQQQANIQRQISDLQLRYGPKHPLMIAANNELDGLDNRLFIEIGEVSQVIVGQYEAAQARVAGLETEVDRVKSEFQAISQQEIEYSELERQVEINRELYNTFLTRARETSQGTGFDSNSARLADPAAAPIKPLDNRIALVTAAAAVAGLLFACFGVLLLELLQDNIRNPDDVELLLRQKMFGLIPLTGNRKSNTRIKARSYFDRKQYQFSEAIKTLRTSLVLSHLDAPAKIISITSSVPSEGKTTLSISLAFALAQGERVLLIDADLRRPSVGKEFDLPQGRPGLTNLIAGTHSEKDCVYRDKASGLDVIASGPIPPDAQQVLNSLRFTNSVKLLAKHYDRIIIDTAPVNAVSDALMISRIADSTLYVVKSGSTRKKVIQRGIDRLSQVGIQIDGVILNQVDINSKAARSEEYYGYYGGQYGYGQEIDNDDFVNSVQGKNVKCQQEALEIA